MVAKTTSSHPFYTGLLSLTVCLIKTQPCQRTTTTLVFAYDTRNKTVSDGTPKLKPNSGPQYNQFALYLLTACVFRKLVLEEQSIQSQTHRTTIQTIVHTANCMSALYGDKQ